MLLYYNVNYCIIFSSRLLDNFSSLIQIEVCYEVHDLQAAEFWENDLNKVPICLKDIALYRQV